jgi:hypothetical protein
LGFDQEIPHHSTFSKNRHGRFQESKLFEELFEQIVRQCVEVGLVQGQHLSVDGSFVEANASKESRIPREQLAEAAQVNQTARQYLVETTADHLDDPVVARWSGRAWASMLRQKPRQVNESRGVQEVVGEKSHYAHNPALSVNACLITTTVGNAELLGQDFFSYCSFDSPATAEVRGVFYRGCIVATSVGFGTPW